MKHHKSRANDGREPSYKEAYSREGIENEYEQKHEAYESRNREILTN